MVITDSASQADNAAQPEVVTDAQAPVVVSVTTENRTTLNAADRDALLFGDAPAAPAKAEEPAETETESPDPAESEPVTDTEPTGKILPNRINTAQFEPREQEAIALRHELAGQGEKISLREACERVDAKYDGRKADTQAPPAPVEPEPVGPSEVEVLQGEAQALADKLSEFDDGLITPEFRRLQSEHAEKLADIKVAKLEAKLASQKQVENQAQQAEKQKAERISAREANKADVLKEYPTANDGKSPLGKEITLLYNEVANDPNHPFRGEMAKDTFPTFLTQKAVESKTAELLGMGFTAAQALGILKGTPPSAAKTAPPAVRPVPRTVLVTQAGSTAAPQAQPALTDRQALERARNDPKFRDTLLGFNGGMIIR